MNLNEADDALTEAVAHLAEASNLLAQAESRVYVAKSNLDFARRHYDAMVVWVAQRERVLRELTIAREGGYQP